MVIREKTEKNEDLFLSKFAKKSIDSKGRERAEEKCAVRTDFARDRDRIIHSKSFRRLRHKTQVFLAPKGDHYRTRLTHTLEVNQVARTVSRALSLNEDLTEAIALGHDLGHTPFGHAGERALDCVVPFSFDHAAQSVREITIYEKDGRGLNLTYETLNGIANHSEKHRDRCETNEAQVVSFADRIAYLNHDIDDAIRAGIIEESDVPFDVHQILGYEKSERITSLVVSLIENSGSDIMLDSKTQAAYRTLYEFMFKFVYKNSAAKIHEEKAEDMIKRIYHYFLQNIIRLPQDYKNTAIKEGNERAVCDYIAGMTDQFLLAVYEDAFIPKVWSF